MASNPTTTLKVFDLSKDSLYPKDFLGTRAKYYNSNSFFNTNIYDRIRYSIKNNMVTFIIGNPLSGKSRIVFDCLKELNTGYIIIPKKEVRINKYLLPNKPNRIVYLDDVDDFCKANPLALNLLLGYALINEIKVIITCRSGPEYTTASRIIDKHIFDELVINQFRIPRFNKGNENLKSFFKNNNITSDHLDSFDGNLGSLILPLSTMRNRYKNLVENDSNRHAVAILLGLKLHFHLYNYENHKNLYDNCKIRIFCNKFSKDELSFGEWETAKKILLSTDSDLNFIDEGEHIEIEEAYLDCLHDEKGNSLDVIDPSLNILKIRRWFRDLYTDPMECQSLGFPISEIDYNMLIVKANNYPDAYHIYSGMPDYISPTTYTFSALYLHCNSREIFIDLYHEMEHKGVSRDRVKFDLFGSFHDNFIELIDDTIGLDARQLYFQNGFTQRLINLAMNKPKESLSHLFKLFSPLHIFSKATLNSLVRHCSNDEDDFTNFYLPNIGVLDKICYPEIVTFVRGCLKLNKVIIGTELVDRYFVKDSFEYYNELANVNKQSNPELSFDYYKKAIEATDDLVEVLKALSNLNSLVQHIDMLKYRSFVLKKSHAFLKENFLEIRFSRTLKYLKFGIAVNEMQRAELTDIKSTFLQLIKLPYLSATTFRTIAQKLDLDRNKMLIETIKKTRKKSE